MHRDTEMLQTRAAEAMDGLEALLELVPASELIETRHIAALVAVTHDAVRKALPTARFISSCND